MKNDILIVSLNPTFEMTSTNESLFRLHGVGASLLVRCSDGSPVRLEKAFLFGGFMAKDRAWLKFYTTMFLTETAGMTAQQIGEHILSAISAWTQSDESNMPKWMLQAKFEADKKSEKYRENVSQRYTTVYNGKQLNTNPSLLISYNQEEEKKKKEEGVFAHTHKAYRCALCLQNCIREWNEGFQKRTEAELQKWAAESDRMKRIDGVSFELQASYIYEIHWDEGTEKFSWRKNILSYHKFRRQMQDGKLNQYRQKAEENLPDMCDYHE